MPTERLLVVKPCLIPGHTNPVVHCDDCGVELAAREVTPEPADSDLERSARHWDYEAEVVPINDDRDRAKAREFRDLAARLRALAADLADGLTVADYENAIRDHWRTSGIARHIRQRAAELAAERGAPDGN